MTKELVYYCANEITQKNYNKVGLNCVLCRSTQQLGQMHPINNFKTTLPRNEPASEISFNGKISVRIHRKEKIHQLTEQTTTKTEKIKK
jgi:hypothetical protein